MAMAEIAYTQPVFTVPYLPARDALMYDPNISPKEMLMLIDCLNMRQQDRAFRDEMRERALRDKALAEAYEKDFIEYCNNSWMPNAIIFRLTSGEDFATNRDFQARDHRIRLINEYTLLRNREFREHDEVVTSEEKRMRDQLSGQGAQAKRLFNTIAISGKTSLHFAPAEIAPAAHLPNPLERLLP